MKERKRLLAGILTFLLVVTGIPIYEMKVQAAQTYQWGDYQYQNISSVTISITKYTGNAESVEIPGEIEGKKVLYIDYDAFAGHSNLKKVDFPEGIVRIASGAFSGCSSLENINFPESLEEMGGYAFSGCSSLKSITIPKNVENIGGSTFANCAGLAEIQVEEGNTTYESKNYNAVIQKSNDCLVLGCKTTTIPESVKVITTYAFEGCSGLTDIRIPESVTEIGREAFKNCTGLI